ncbi:dTDP-4-dehydrorhamnose 3,5-epimerase family protein [Actinomarinicola tropica]|nr:dTDP-4-dehydrorhamnose 3,5-epimerase [Actinomarinicola tropica]
MTDIIDLDASESPIPGLWVVRMKQITDERGTVREFFRESALRAAGVPPLGRFRQINVTSTRHGGLRGMHAESMDKLVAVVAGEALGAYVDLRDDSPAFGRVHTVALVPGVQVLVPRGVGNGFQAVAPGDTQYLYCFDEEWRPGMPGRAVTPLDPELGIDWPIAVDVHDRAQISAKDLEAPTLADLRAG